MEDNTVITTAPPPPSQVKIRTMRSDIDSMMQSGGGVPSFQSVSVLGLSMDKKFKAPTTFVRTPIPTVAQVQAPASASVVKKSSAIPDNAPASAPAAGPRSDFIPKLVVGLVALVAIGAVGYFAYTIFVK